MSRSDRQRAGDADERELHRLRDGNDTAALDAGSRRSEQFRTSMPEHQRTLERQLRDQWTLQRHQQSLEQAAFERQAEPSRTIQADIHCGIERGCALSNH